MIIGPSDEREGLAAIAERLATAYALLLDHGDASLDPVMDELFDALASIDILAGGLTSPVVRTTLDPG